MRILCLDPGTRTGWATNDGRSGAIDLWLPSRKGSPGRPVAVFYKAGPKKGQVRLPAVRAVEPIPDEPKDRRLYRLWCWLEKVRGCYPALERVPDAPIWGGGGLGPDCPQVVVIEGSDGFMRGANAVRCANELRGVVKLWAQVHRVALVQVEPGDLKRFATGKANAKKPEMLEAARRRLSYPRDDEDEVDAIWLREWAKVHVATPARAEPA
jgi:hypothetical protein